MNIIKQRRSIRKSRRKSLRKSRRKSRRKSLRKSLRKSRRNIKRGGSQNIDTSVCNEDMCSTDGGPCGMLGTQDFKGVKAYVYPPVDGTGKLCYKNRYMDTLDFINKVKRNEIVKDPPESDSDEDDDDYIDQSRPVPSPISQGSTPQSLPDQETDDEPDIDLGNLYGEIDDQEDFDIVDESTQSQITPSPLGQYSDPLSDSSSSDDESAQSQITPSPLGQYSNPLSDSIEKSERAKSRWRDSIGAHTQAINIEKGKELARERARGRQKQGEKVSGLIREIKKERRDVNQDPVPISIDYESESDDEGDTSSDDESPRNVTYRGTITRQGPLGLRLADTIDKTSKIKFIIIQEIFPNSIVAESIPGIKVGMVLRSIDNESIDGLSFDEVINKLGTRPIDLEFSDNKLQPSPSSKLVSPEVRTPSTNISSELINSIQEKTKLIDSELLKIKKELCRNGTSSLC